MRELFWYIIILGTSISAIITIISNFSHPVIVTNDGLFLFFLLIATGFIVTITSFFLINYLKKLKILVYDGMLHGIRLGLNRNELDRWDALGFVLFSLTLNSLLLTLFSTVPVNYIFSLIPAGDFLNEAGNGIFDIQITSSGVGALILMSIIIISGPSFILILRLLHHRYTRIVNDEQFPGSRILLTSFIFLPIILAINIVSLKSFSIEPIEAILRVGMIFSVVVILIMWVIDNTFFKDKTLVS